MQPTERTERPNLIRELLTARLLQAGDLLSARRSADLQAEVLPNGKLMLNKWRVPMGLREATQKAYGIAEYGLMPHEPKLRGQNPLNFWHYWDEYSNRDERLSRLHQLLSASCVVSVQPSHLADD